MGGQHKLGGRGAAGRRFADVGQLSAGTAYAIIRLMKQEYRPAPIHFGDAVVDDAEQQNGAGQ